MLNFNRIITAKLYSGGEPELVDGDIFKTIVPLNLSFNKMNDNQILNDNLNDNQILNDNLNDNQILNDNLNDNQILNDNKDRDCILAYIVQNGAISTTQAAQTIGRSHSTAHRILILNPTEMIA